MSSLDDFYADEAKRQQTDNITAPTVAITAPKPSANDADAFWQEEARKQQQQISVSLNQAVQNNPADAASIDSLSRATGLPFGVVENQFKVLSAQKRQAEVQTVLDASPQLKKQFFENPVLPKIAHDDVGVLGRIEDSLKNFSVDDVESWGNSGAKGLGGAYNDASLAVNKLLLPAAEGLDKLQGTLTGPQDTYAKGWYEQHIAPLEANRHSFELAPTASLGDRIAYTVGNLGGLMSQIELTGAGLPRYAKAAVEAAPSVAKAMANFATQAIKSAAFPSLTSATNTASDVYSQTGSLPDAMQAFYAQYLGSTGMMAIPIAAPGGLATRVAGGAISGAASSEVVRQWMNANMPESMQQEFHPEEMALNALSMALMAAPGHAPRGEVSDYLAAARQTYVDATKADQAQKSYEMLGQISQLSQLSQLRGRDPEAFKEVVSKLTEDGKVADVYVDVRDLADALHQAGIDATELGAKMPEVAAQLQEAAQTNGIVRIPVADYAGHIAGTKVDEALLQHLKATPDGMTVSEATTYHQGQVEEMTKAAERMAQSRSQTDEARADSQVVYDHVLGQLDAGKRFAPEVNKLYATLAQAGYSTMGRKLGLSPEEFLARYPLHTAFERMGGGGFDQGNAALEAATQDWQKALRIASPRMPEYVPFVYAPSVLKEMQFKAASLNFPTKVIRTIRSEHPDIPPDVWENLPKYFHDPLYVIPHKGDGLRVFLDAVTEKGEPIFVGVSDGRVHTISPLHDEQGAKGKDRMLEMVAKEVEKRGVKVYARDKTALSEARAVRSLRQVGHNSPGSDTKLNATVFGREHLVKKYGAAFYQAAYHGSPHTFDRFSLDHIGSGEGAQAYGWGLYFAESPGVAAGYHRALADAPGIKEMRLGSLFLNDRNGFDYTRRANENTRENVRASLAEDLLIRENDVRGAGTGEGFRKLVLDTLDEKIAEYESQEPPYTEGVKAAKELRSMLEKPGALSVTFHEAEGGVYQVDIPDEYTNKFLLWDKPMSEQPPGVRKALEAVGYATDKFSAVSHDTSTGEQFYRFLGNDKTPATYSIKGTDGQYQAVDAATRQEAIDMAGGDASRVLEVKNGDIYKAQEYASKFLDSIGIKGIKYLDMDSRNEGSGTHNLVVFDDSIIKLTHKDGRPVSEPERAAYFQKQGENNRGAYDPATGTVALLKNADLSTYLHELGHHFLEMSADMASRADAPPEVAKDFDTLLKWFGVQDAATWHNLSLDEKRSYHEQFARGFESYLMEGKAPSGELQGAFSRFRSWLVHVYKSLTALNVELTPEVRGVFDRMLASEEQIRTAEQARGYQALFKTPEEAAKYGLTPEDFAGYQQLGQQASEDAVQQLEGASLRDMRWLSNAKSKALRGLQREAASKRREVRMEVAKEVWSQPVYRAWQFLTSREVAPATPKEATGKGLDPARDTLFEAIAKLGGLDRKAVVSEWGVDPADMKQAGATFKAKGGKSIDGMVEALAEHGYLKLDKNGKADIHELEAKIADGLRGTDHFADAHDFTPPERDTTAADYKDIPGGRLNTDQVPVEYVDKLAKLRMTRKDADDPDIVAELFGFGSGRELAHALTEAEHPRDVVEGMTDQRMLERHGELSDPQAIERAAEAAIHNEARARVLATELRAVSRAQGPARMLADAAKAAAEAAINAKKIQDLRPLLYTTAEAKAQRNAEKALAKGDTAEVASEKRAALLNNRLAKVAADAIQEIRKGVDYLGKFNKPGVRENIDVDYREQIDQLLERYDLRRSVTNTDISRRQSLREWYASQIDAGMNPGISDKLMDDMQARHVKELTVEEFRGLVDAVKSIEKLGRLKETLRDGQETRQLRSVVDEAVENTAKLPQRIPESNRGLTRMSEKWLNAKSMTRSADASLLKIEQVMDWLDDHNPLGVFNRVVFRRIADAAVRENDLRTEMTGRLKALVQAMPKENRHALSERITLPELIDSKTGKPSTLTKSELLAMALNTGNESNMAKLAAGEGWKERDIWTVLHRYLDKADWDFVQGVWDSVNSLYPEIAALERRLGNDTPPKVEARPFSTQHGDYAGGYYPMIYDPLRSYDAEQNRQRSGDHLFENNYVRATTPKGHTIARAENYARPVLLSLEVLPRHLNQVIHDLAFREAIIDADRFLAQADIRKAVENTLGIEYYKQFRPWLQSLANDKNYDSKGLAFWDKAAHAARTTSTIVGLGYRITTMLIHGSTAASNSVGEIGAKWFASGLKDTLGSPAKMVAAKDFIFERSGEMRNRMNEVDRDIRDQLREMDLSASQGPQGKARVAADTARRFAYYGISMLDMASALPTWQGAYNKALTPESRGGLGMSEEQAVYFADKAVRNAHGGGGAKDLSAWQRGPEFQKLFSMFYSFWNHFYNRQRDIARIAGQIPGQVRAGDYQGARRDFAMVLARSWFYFIIPQLLHAALKPPAPNQQDDDLPLAAWVAEEVALGLFSGIPVVRDVANSAFTGRDYNATPATSIIEAGFRTGKDIHDAMSEDKTVSDKWLKHSITTAGYIFGLPLGQPASTMQFLWDLGNGKQEPQDLADWWAGVVHGDIHRH